MRRRRGVIPKDRFGLVEWVAFSLLTGTWFYLLVQVALWRMR